MCLSVSCVLLLSAACAAAAAVSYAKTGVTRPLLARDVLVSLGNCGFCGQCHTAAAWPPSLSVTLRQKHTLTKSHRHKQATLTRLEPFLRSSHLIDTLICLRPPTSHPSQPRPIVTAYRQSEEWLCELTNICHSSDRIELSIIGNPYTPTLFTQP